MLQLQNVSKSYNYGKNKEYVLKELNFKICKGEMVAITGKSGSGKSTFLNIIANIIPFDDGKIIFNEKELSQSKSREQSDFRLKHIGYITQSFHLLDDRNVFHNIALPLQYMKLNRQLIKKEVADVMEQLEISHLQKKSVTTLSGGERQRVAIARAVVKKPDLILADEPTGALDDEMEAVILDMIDSINKNGTSIIMVTHDANVAEFCNKKYKIQDKKLCTV